MATDQDVLYIGREMLLFVLDLQVQIVALQLVVQQKTSITLEEIQAAKMEVERRKPGIQALRKQIQDVGLADLLKVLKDHEGTVQ